MAKIQSRPLDGPIVVDANQSEWWGALTDIGSDLSVGFRNDAEYLYVSIMTSDEDLVNQLMLEGLVVWFDPTGQKAESFGIRFPLGVLDPATRERMYERSMSGGRVLTPGGDTVRIESSSGIEFEGRADYGGFIYELRVPLRSGPEQPYAIGAEPGQTIAIGFTTPEIDMDELFERAGQRGGGAPPGGSAGGRPQPGGVSGGGPGGPGGGGARGFSLPSPLEKWTSVTLAD